MKRFLLDTGSASDLINRRGSTFAKARDVTAQGGRVGVCTPVVGEFFAGIELSRSREANRVALLRALSALFIWPFDRPAAEEYGRIFAALRRMGRPKQHVDMQVAGVAFSLGDCIVVSKDSDLPAVPGLTVEDWSR